MNWVQYDKTEGREGDLKRKFLEEEANSERSSEKEHCVYRVVRMHLWEKLKVYGGKGRGTTCDKDGKMHPKQAGH